MRSLALAAATIAVLALPAPALAATASKTGGTVSVTGAGTEDNRLTVTVDGLSLRIVETGSGVTLTAGAGCSNDITNNVLCPLAGTTLISMAGNGDGDFLTNETSIAGSLDGGGDNDVLTGGTGADTFTGGTGDDYANYEDRTATIVADLDGVADDGEPGEGDNVGTDVETLIGGSANDTLTGNSDNNGLDGGLGTDTLTGNGGNDYALYWTRTNAVNVSLDGVADDGEPGENDIIAADVESVWSGSGADTLTGNSGDNDLIGGNGDDTLDGLEGADDLYGLGDVDTVSYANQTAAVTVNPDGTANDGAAGEGDNAVAENIIGGSAGDALTGDAGANVLDGRGGGDVLNGLGGDDRVSYSAHSVAVTADLDGASLDDGAAGEGDTIAADIENLTGGSGPDTLTGSANVNDIDGGPGDDVLDGGAGADTLTGQGGSDTVSYASRTASVTVDLDGVPGDDGESGEADTIAADVENLTGGRGIDSLTGDAGPNVLDGGLGADTLAGLGGTDRVTYESRTAAVTADLDGVADDGETGEGDTIATDVEELTGGAGADTLTGSAVVNRLDGRGGADTLHARDSSADQAICGTHVDTVVADTSDDAAADCETVDVPVPPEPPAAPKPTPKIATKPKPKAKAVKIKLSSKPITIGRDGKAPVVIACPKAQTGGCAGTVTIELPVETTRAKGKAKTSRRSRRKVVGKAKFKVKAGKRKTIRVRLSRRGRRKVLRKRRQRCRVSVVNKGQDGKKVTTKLNVTLKAPKPKLKVKG